MSVRGGVGIWYTYPTPPPGYTYLPEKDIGPQVPTPPCEQTDICKNITFPFAGGKNKTETN